MPPILAIQRLMWKRTVLLWTPHLLNAEQWRCKVHLSLWNCCGKGNPVKEMRDTPWGSDNFKVTISLICGSEDASHISQDHVYVQNRQRSKFSSCIAAVKSASSDVYRSLFFDHWHVDRMQLGDSLSSLTSKKFLYCPGSADVGLVWACSYWLTGVISALPVSCIIKIQQNEVVTG